MRTVHDRLCIPPAAVAVLRIDVSGNTYPDTVKLPVVLLCARQDILCKVPQKQLLLQAVQGVQQKSYKSAPPVV